MAITVGVPKETLPGEQRVALVPAVAAKLVKKGMRVVMEAGAAESALVPDSAYTDVEFVSKEDVYAQADILLKVAPPTVEEAGLIKEGSILMSFAQAHNNAEMVDVLLERNVTSLAMELVPRISRAQAIDALSSQASIAGYKAVLMAANLLGRYMPMLTTAAGTIRPAKTLVIGAGVAGLQAIATARRLGAMVEAYDVRPEVAEQIESLGAKFVDTGVSAAGSGGYARELSEDEKQQQRDVLAKHIAKSDAVITTAAIPGRPSPKIITKEMVEGMKPGAAIVDLAAEGGGNCELSQPGETIVVNNVTIHAPLNVPSMLAEHSSEMYAKNLENFLELFVEEGELKMNWEDEVIVGSALTHAGGVLHAPSAEALGKAVAAAPTVAEEPAEEAPAEEPAADDSAKEGEA